MIDPISLAIAGGASLLGGLFGGGDPPEWRDISENPEDYNYDPSRLGYGAYLDTVAEGMKAQGLLGTLRGEQLNRRRRQAAEFIPGMSSFRATPGSQGITGGTSAVLAKKNYMDAQTRGQEWADANFNATPYDLAMAEMPLRARQAAAPYMGMEQDRMKTGMTLATEAKFMNAQGRMGQQNAGWQARQAKWNALGNFGAGLIGQGFGYMAQSSLMDDYFKKYSSMSGSGRDSGFMSGSSGNPFGFNMAPYGGAWGMEPPTPYTELDPQAIFPSLR